MFVKATKSIFDKRVRLTEERWKHIVERHPEVEGYLEMVLKTVSAPEIVTHGWTDESCAIMSVGDQDLVVIYKDQVDGFVVTAFLSRSRKYFEKRGIIWSKQ